MRLTDLFQHALARSVIISTLLPHVGRQKRTVVVSARPVTKDHAAACSLLRPPPVGWGGDGGEKKKKKLVPRGLR